MLDIRPVLFVLGVMLCILAGAMLIPAMVDLYNLENDWRSFASSMAITAFAGLVLIYSNRQKKISLNLRQAFMLTPLSWIVLAAFGAFPLYFSDLNLTFSQAYFETVSGITTTGSTVIVGLDSAATGVLLWRGILQFLGGIGFIAAATAILPMLGIGGMQLFKTEGDASQKFVPRTSQIAKYILGIYIFLNVACALLYYHFGMSGLDAVVHAFATIGTGGFSNHDTSFAYFKSSSLEVIAMIFMLAGAMPVVLYYRILKGDYKSFLRSSQVQTYLAIILILSLSLAAYTHYNGTFFHPWSSDPGNNNFWEALRYSAFSVISIITTTGFTNIDYSTWGPFPVMAFFLIMSIGGCTGSTAGGIKIFRIQILYKSAKAQVNRLISPHGVFNPQYEGKSLSEELISSVLGFFILFALSFSFTALLLTLTGLDFLTSLSSAITMLGNVGPALGEIAGPSGNFSSFSSLALWVCSFAMLLGRLEIFVVIVLFSKNFWRE